MGSAFAKGSLEFVGAMRLGRGDGDGDARVGAGIVVSSPTKFLERLGRGGSKIPLGSTREPSQ